MVYATDLGGVTTVEFSPVAVGQVKKRQKIKYAGMAELADAPDLGSVTTVEFLLQRFAQFKICLTNRSLWRINAYAESH